MLAPECTSGPGRPVMKRVVAMIAAACLFVAGCASTLIELSGLWRDDLLIKAYEGPALPRHHLALLSYYGAFGELLVIDQIDGKTGGWPSSTGPALDSFHGQRKIAVLPGRHTMSFTLYARPTGGAYPRDIGDSEPLEFEAEAGHAYTVHAESREMRNWFWIEDIWTEDTFTGETTGEVVAGKKAPDLLGAQQEP